jgi:hypothetical protein
MERKKPTFNKVKNAEFHQNDKKTLCFLVFSFADLLKITNFAVAFQKCCGI